MNIQVLEDRTVNIESYMDEKNLFGTQNENGIEELVFEIPETYLSFEKKIVFITNYGNFAKEIVNNSYILENDITQYNNIKAYVWCYNSETEEDFRSKVFDVKFFDNENSTEEIPNEIEIN